MRNRLEIRISPELSLLHDPCRHEGKTSGMGKGMFPAFRGVACAGESAGVGLPVLKTKARTFFPSLSSARKAGPSVIEKTFRMDRVIVWYLGKSRIPEWFGWMAEHVVEQYMKRARLQHGLLGLREAVFPLLRIRSEMATEEDRGRCLSRYEACDGGVRVSIDAASLEGRGRLIVLNECDGRRFTRVRMGERLCEGSRIPAWDETTFDAVFESPSLGIGLSLSPGEGEAADRYAVFCGREVGAGLNWAGLAIECPMPAFSYRVRFHSPANPWSR